MSHTTLIVHCHCRLLFLSSSWTAPEPPSLLSRTHKHGWPHGLDAGTAPLLLSNPWVRVCCANTAAIFSFTLQVAFCVLCEQRTKKFHCFQHLHCNCFSVYFQVGRGETRPCGTRTWCVACFGAMTLRGRTCAGALSNLNSTSARYVTCKS